MQLLLHLLVFFLSIFGNVFSFITRHSCKYHANFTLVYDVKYFKTTDVLTTLTMVDRHKCSLKCVLEHRCVMFNRKKDGTSCELIGSHVGSFEKKADWEVVTTDYSDYRFRGPMCSYIRPNIPSTKYCIDACGHPGYEMHELAKAASLIAHASSNMLLAQRLFDGKLGEGNGWGPPTMKIRQHWIQIVFAKVYTVIFLEFAYTRVPKRSYRMSLKIGTVLGEGRLQNPVCEDNVDHSTLSVARVDCANGPMGGSTLVVTAETSGQERMAIGEITPFVL